MELWSIGHSTHPLDRLVELLALHEVTLLADVRTVPRSRRHPHVATEALAASLPARGIAYRHLRGWAAGDGRRRTRRTAAGATRPSRGTPTTR